MKNRFIFILFVTIILPSCNDNEGGTHTSPSEFTSLTASKIKSINSDSSENHIIQTTATGTAVTLTTSSGTTTLALPSASASATGLVTSANFTTFNNKVSEIVQDTTPQLGGNLDVNGNSIVSTANANINLQPNGTGQVVSTSPVSRSGFFQAYVNVNSGNIGAANLAVDFQVDEREDADFYSHIEGGATPSEITILQAGDYKIHYYLNMRSSSGTDWQNYESWLEVNAVAQNHTYSYCVAIDSNTNRRNCTNSGAFILTLAANDVLRLIVNLRSNRGNAYVKANESWIMIERI